MRNLSKNIVQHFFYTVKLLNPDLKKKKIVDSGHFKGWSSVVKKTKTKFGIYFYLREFLCNFNAFASILVFLSNFQLFKFTNFTENRILKSVTYFKGKGKFTQSLSEDFLHFSQVFQLLVLFFWCFVFKGFTAQKF